MARRSADALRLVALRSVGGGDQPHASLGRRLNGGIPCCPTHAAFHAVAGSSQGSGIGRHWGRSGIRGLSTRASTPYADREAEYEGVLRAGDVQRLKLMEQDLGYLNNPTASYLKKDLEHVKAKWMLTTAIKGADIHRDVAARALRAELAAEVVTLRAKVGPGVAAAISVKDTATAGSSLAGQGAGPTGLSGSSNVGSRPVVLLAATAGVAVAAFGAGRFLSPAPPSPQTFSPSSSSTASANPPASPNSPVNGGMSDAASPAAGGGSSLSSQPNKTLGETGVHAAPKSVAVAAEASAAGAAPSHKDPASGAGSAGVARHGLPAPVRAMVSDVSASLAAATGDVDPKVAAATAATAGVFLLAGIWWLFARKGPSDAFNGGYGGGGTGESSSGFAPDAGADAMKAALEAGVAHFIVPPAPLSPAGAMAPAAAWGAAATAAGVAASQFIDGDEPAQEPDICGKA